MAISVDRSKRLRNALILALVFSCPLVAVTVLYFVRNASRRSVIADPAIYAAQTSQELIALLGDPMLAGKPGGNFVSKGGSGNADLTIPLEGPKGKGTLLEWAQQVHGKWHLCGLDFHPDYGKNVMLVDETKSHCQPE